MSDLVRRPLASLDDASLDAALADLAGALAVPTAPDVSAAVGARLRARLAAVPRRAPASRLRWALIAALIGLLALAAIAAGRGFGLPGLQIFFATPALPTAPPPTPAPTTAIAARPSLPSTFTPAPPVGATLAPINGVRTTVADAQREVAFQIRLPDAGLVGDPAFVYLDGEVPGGEVILVWIVADSAGSGDLPIGPDGQGRVEFVLTELRGNVDEGLLGKSLGPGNTITPVDVGGGVSGLWIDGPVHQLFVHDATGNVREAATRDVGNVLAWVRNGVLYRIETNHGLDGALPVARSIP